MSNRYHMALAQGRAAYEAVVNEDQELLRSFGLRLLSIEGGAVRAVVEAEVKNQKHINPWEVVEINMKTWNWVRPLLSELRRTRKADMVLEQLRRKEIPAAAK